MGKIDADGVEGVETARVAEPPAQEKTDAVPNYAEADGASEDSGDVYPTDEEMTTLRHVHGKVSWLIYSIGFVELVERFAYYGTTTVCKSACPRPHTRRGGR